jgi:hypothetical protein
MAESRQAAEEVRRVLEKRAAALAGQPGDANLVLNYWDQVTRAEAELLLGNLGAAQRFYRAAFAGHADQRANIAVSRAQMEGILRALGLSLTADAFLERLHVGEEPSGSAADCGPSPPALS